MACEDIILLRHTGMDKLLFKSQMELELLSSNFLFSKFLAGAFHKRLLLVSCSVIVVVIQSSTPCQQTFPRCKARLVWLVLGAWELSLWGFYARLFFSELGLSCWSWSFQAPLDCLGARARG